MKKTNTIKRILSLALALLMVFSMMPRITLGASAVNMTGGEKLYLKPNTNWVKDGARFAAYFFGSSNTWVDMTKVAGEKDLYEVTAPSGNWTNVIFCRMTPSASANDWDNRWNQTGDLTYDGTMNLFTVPAGVWDTGTTGWSVYTPPVPETEPPATQAPATEAPATEAPAVENVTVYAINSMRWGTVCAYVWDVDPYVAWPGAAMTKTGETVNGFDVYSYTFPENCVSIIFNNNAGVQTADVTVKAGQYYDIKSGEWYASLSDVPYVDPLSTGVYLLGGFNGWSAVQNEFKKAEASDTAAQVTLELAAETTYEFKIINNGEWTSTSTAITGDASGVSFSSSVGGNAKITTKAAGEYVFTYDLTANTLSVTYPQASTEPVPTEPEAPAEPNAENTTGALLNLFCRTVEDHAALQLGFHPDFCTVLETGYDAGEEYFWADVQVRAKNYAEYAAGQNSAFAGHTMDEMDEEIFTITFKWNGSAWIPSGTQDVSFTCVPAEPAGKQYALFGYINGAPYGCEEDWENIGEYIFVDGKLTVTFTSDSYIAVKTTDNTTWYMTDGWEGEATSVTLYHSVLLDTRAEKLMVPGGVELTFTLVENADGTLTLSYSDGSEDEEPTEPVPTEPEETEPESETVTVFFQNNWMWDDVCIYFWGSEIVDLPAWPGFAMELAGNDGNYDIYKYEVPADVQAFLFNGLKDDGSGTRDQSPDITEGFYNGICYYMLWNDGNVVGSEDISVILPGTEVKPDPTPDPEPDPTDPEPDPDAFIIYFDPNGVEYPDGAFYRCDLTMCEHTDGYRAFGMVYDEESGLYVSGDLAAKGYICGCEGIEVMFYSDYGNGVIVLQAPLEKDKVYEGPAPTISADDVQKAFTVHVQADCGGLTGKHSDFVQLGEVTENDGVYTCVVTIQAKDFAEYTVEDFDILWPECAPHSADPENPETIEVTLTWDAENQEWTAAEEDQHIYVYILCTDNSPQPTFVAQIGEITYETLADAFNAAESGDVIKLLSDDCINETDIPEGVVLDLNGHKLAITNTPFTGRISFNGGSLIPAAAPTMEMLGPNGMIMKTTDGIIDLTELNMILVGGTFTMSAAGGVVLVAGTAKLIVPDDYTINLSCILNSADASIVGPADMDVVTERAGYTVVYANGTYTLALSDEVVKIYIEYHDEPVIPGLTAAADNDNLYYVEVKAGEDLVLTMPEAKGIFVLETYNSEDDSYTTTNSKADGTVAMPWEVISDEGVEYLWLAHYPNKVTVNLNGGSLSDETMSWFYDYGGELAEDGKSATMYYPIHNWIMLEYELEWSTFVKEGCTLIGFRLNGGTEIVDRFECVDGLVVDLVWKGGCEAMIWGEAFETLEEAIEAAEKGDIVRLCADVSVDELALFNGIILDLDGHTLNVAKYITVYADNHIVDYEGGGLLKSKYVMIDDGNSALPIWDEARGGYIFVRTSDFKLQVEELSENSTKCVFLPYLSEEAYALLAQGMETSGAALKIEVFWERADGKMASIIFCFTDDLMVQFAEKYPTADRKAFSLTLTGTADKKISYRVFFESVTGVEYECRRPK